VTTATRSPATTTAGGAVAVRASGKNQGSQATGFTVSVYLSTDATFDGADVQVGSVSVPGLAAGATLSGTIPATIPGGQAPGNYFLLVRADTAGEVSEANETNNVRSAGTLIVQ
jgi:subtilase family serine protease